MLSLDDTRSQCLLNAVLDSPPRYPVRTELLLAICHAFSVL
jgi:hypothetical protein